ncbi:MAG: tagaturonate reductase, partial [Collinsella sp.]
PAKLAQVLHTRWAAGKPGVIVLACELIDHNGEELLRIMNQYVSDWGWEDEFAQWMANDCTVCTTLVDTIVPGRIRDPKEAAAVAERLGYEDPFLAVREPFQMWGIQGDESLAEKLPFVKAGLPGVFVTPDVTPYKKRKVRILNGAHTAFVPGSWVAGFDIVRDCMHDETIRGFMITMLYYEVIPTLAADLDVEDCKAFAAAVENRFDNPFIDHALLPSASTHGWAARFVTCPRSRTTLPRPVTCPSAWRRASLRSSPLHAGVVSREGDGFHLRRLTAPSTPLRTTPSGRLLRRPCRRRRCPAGARRAHQRADGARTLRIAGLEEFVVSALAVVRAEGAKQAFANAQA